MRRRTLLKPENAGITGQEVVDMGLSVDWCTYDLGASNPEEPGSYFSWGETEGYKQEDLNIGKKYFSQNDYKFGWPPTKYNSSDGKTVLDPEDDAATAMLGEEYRMPTKEEYQELVDACNVTRSTANNRNVEIFTLKTDPTKQVKFIWGGFGVDDVIMGPTCEHWTREKDISDPEKSYMIQYSVYNVVSYGSYERYYGLRIRPVKIKPFKGVYIEGIDGELYTRSTWDSSKTANSIVFADEKMSVRIALNDAKLPVAKSTNVSFASLDIDSLGNLTYNGKKNTEEILKIVPYTDCAAGYCNSYSFPNGETGYLPSAGELSSIGIKETLDEINKCLEIVGGDAFQFGYNIDYVTSSRYGNTTVEINTLVKAVFVNYEGLNTYFFKSAIGNTMFTDSFLVRPFSIYTKSEPKLSVRWETMSGEWNKITDTSGESHPIPDFDTAIESSLDKALYKCKSPGTDGSTVIRAYVKGKAGDKIRFNGMSRAESTYDYLTIGELDTSCTRDSYNETTKGKQNEWLYCEYELPDNQEHYVEFCFSKDSSQDTQPDDSVVYVSKV